MHFLRRLRPLPKTPLADPALARTRLGALREDHGRFAALRGARVLIYWPHGLGDWATLGVVAPLLEPSNRYAITRFGDDYTSLLHDNPILRPLYSGVRAPGDGAAQGARHLGLTLAHCDGRKVHLALPEPLDEAIAAFAPEVLLWSDYPETEGRTPFPYHTKARNLARRLVCAERLRGFDLGAPLPNAIDFSPAPAALRAVDARLDAAGFSGTRIGLLSRTGFTAPRKNWGDGSQARAFVAAMRARGFRFVSMDDEALGENVVGFRALFGDLPLPFARVLNALLARSELVVGVPAGPFHVAMARGGIPTVGIWMAHHPDWYDEPNAVSVHLVARFVRERGFHRRAATVTKPPALRHRIEYLESAEVPADAAIAAAEQVLR